MMQRTLLHLASLYGRTETAKFYLEKHIADVNAVDKNGYAPLHFTGMLKLPEIAEMLIEKGADVNLTDNGGYTPLHCAAIGGDIKIAQLLLDHKSDVNARDKSGLTPMAVAMNNGHKKLVDFLKKKGGIL